MNKLHFLKLFWVCRKYNAPMYSSSQLRQLGAESLHLTDLGRAFAAPAHPCSHVIVLQSTAYIMSPCWWHSVGFVRCLMTCMALTGPVEYLSQSKKSSWSRKEGQMHMTAGHEKISSKIQPPRKTIPWTVPDLPPPQGVCEILTTQEKWTYNLQKQSNKNKL